MAHLEGAPKHGKPAHLLPQTYKRMISEWLEEDTPTFDYGGFVVGDEMAEAKLLGKSAVGLSFQVLRRLTKTVSGHHSGRPLLRRSLPSARLHVRQPPPRLLPPIIH